MTQNKKFTIPEWAKNCTVYEVNLRQFTQEGTFQAFEKHLPRLKKIGIDVLWFMPIYPIGQQNKKGALGSVYAVKDYLTVDSSYGTFNDFKNLVKKIHDMDMYVILDWVANHTAWDHVWINSHPDRYTKNEYGHIIAPPNTDWSDVADLNYNNPETAIAMIDALKFWITETNIDGYRCDMAGLVPINFWIEARRELEKIKNIFMLAEWEKVEIHKAFDISYSWELHHLMNKISRKEKNIYDLDHYRTYEITTYQPEDFRLIFTSNHDENSWQGSVYKRMGNAAIPFAVSTFLLPGMPLIYNGQEAKLDKSLLFFDKDTINWSSFELEDFYSKLIKLKKSNPALWNGKFGGTFTKVFTTNNDHIYAFLRIKDKNKVFCLLNLSFHHQVFKTENHLLNDKFTEYFNNEKIEFSAQQEFKLNPWEYRVYIADES